MTKTNELRADQRGSVVSWWALVVSALALLLSGFNSFDMYWRTDLSVIPSKQVRLHAGFTTDTAACALPVIYMILDYANEGGRSCAVMDTRLVVACDSGGAVRWTRVFESLREIPNFLYALGETPQNPVAPVVVSGHSSEVRQYAFFTPKTIQPSEMPNAFSLRIVIEVREGLKWVEVGTYSCIGGNVWRDLTPNNKSFNIVVLELLPVSS